MSTINRRLGGDRNEHEKLPATEEASNSLKAKNQQEQELFCDGKRQNVDTVCGGVGTVGKRLGVRLGVRAERQKLIALAKRKQKENERLRSLSPVPPEVLAGFANAGFEEDLW